MKRTDLYALFAAEVGPALTEVGFVSGSDCEWARSGPDGRDRVYLDVLPRGRFTLMLGYYPTYLDWLRSFLAPGEDIGFPCGPYLGPTRVSDRESHWSFKNGEQARESMRRVVVALRAVGLPWLKALRNPGFFLREADPNGVLGVGLAAEHAGDLDRACEAYRDAWRRYSEIVGSLGASTPPEASRAFVFLALKLGMHVPDLEAWQERLNYFPVVRRIR